MALFDSQAIAPLCTHLVTKDHPRAFGFVNGVKYNNTDSKMELLVEQACLSASTTELRKCKQQWWFSWRNRLSSGEKQSEEPQHAVGFLMLCPLLSCRHPKAS
ncbi:uncharacterized protein LOC111477676 [Cucurbita maxima]|uniref:Uncharacterized protein LOC111477676 n=1 Tax=Cucurbita maxima TaxID=3661 RepID=A0A6J1ILZ7_CUCMA|nr:uncharacterized protein LOC111477676 [Cucurbita maxima]